MTNWCYGGKKVQLEEGSGGTHSKEIPARYYTGRKQGKETLQRMQKKTRTHKKEKVQLTKAKEK